jgi:hypothetical protein
MTSVSGLRWLSIPGFLLSMVAVAMSVIGSGCSTEFDFKSAPARVPVKGLTIAVKKPEYRAIRATEAMKRGAANAFLSAGYTPAPFGSKATVVISDCQAEQESDGCIAVSRERLNREYLGKEGWKDNEVSAVSETEKEISKDIAKGGFG